MVPKLYGAWTVLEKNPVDHFAMLTPHGSPGPQPADIFVVRGKIIVICCCT